MRSSPVLPSLSNSRNRQRGGLPRRADETRHRRHGSLRTVSPTRATVSSLVNLTDSFGISLRLPMRGAAEYSLGEALHRAGRCSMLVAPFAFKDRSQTNPRSILHERHHGIAPVWGGRSEEHTSELQSLAYLVCRL